MWDISDAEKGLPEGCAVYVREDVANAVWDQAVEACIAQMRKLAERADQIDDTEGAFMLRSAEFKLESLKRSDKENGDG